MIVFIWELTNIKYIKERLKLLYYHFTAWMSAVHSHHDDFDQISTFEKSDRSAYADYILKIMQDDEVEVKLSFDSPKRIIFDVKEGWLGVASIQLKYLMTDNLVGALVCEYCKQPFSYIYRRTRFCPDCNEIAKRKERSRRNGR